LPDLCPGGRIPAACPISRRRQKIPWQKGLSELAAVDVGGLFGIVIWVGLVISSRFFNGITAGGADMRPDRGLEK
jgi:hypothetical protein